MHLLNHSEVVELVALKAKCTKTEADRIIRALSSVTTEALNDDKAVVLINLGRIKPVVRAPRQARNVRTGEPISLPEKYSAKLTPSKFLLTALGNK